MCKLQFAGVCRIGLTAAIALGAAGARSSQDANGAQRYQSFGYNSQLKQCASPAACGIGKPTASGSNNGENSRSRAGDGSD
jgi:hypothetical protein